MKACHLFLGLLIGCIFLVSGCVGSDRYTALENRVMSLELDKNRQVNKSSQQQKKDEQNFQKMAADIEQNENSINEKYADTMVRIQELQAEMQRLKGMIEETNYSIQSGGTQGGGKTDTTIERLDLAISRNFERIVALEKYMGFEPTGTPQPAGQTGQTGPAGAAGAAGAAGQVEPEQPVSQIPGPNATESELYTYAKKLLDEGDRENSRIQFENFINRFPESQNADNARFWIADSYFTDKWYEKAILEYQKVLEQYPESNKTAAALLKQGYAFAELGENANARLILKELIKKSPDSNEAKYASEKLKSLN